MKLGSTKSVASSCQAHSPSSQTQNEHSHLSGFDTNTFHFLWGKRTPLQAALGPLHKAPKESSFASVIPNAEQRGLVSLGTKPPRGSRAELAPNHLGELRFHIVLLHLEFRILVKQKPTWELPPFLWVNIAAGSKADLLILFSFL